MERNKNNAVVKGFINHIFCLLNLDEQGLLEKLRHNDVLMYNGAYRVTTRERAKKLKVFYHLTVQEE